MSLGLFLIILLVVLAVGSHPRWPYARNWGYYPSGGISIVAVVVIVLILTHTI